MDAKAIKLIDMVMQYEGGYADKKIDGHETYRGITRTSHPNWEGWKIIDSKKPLKYNQIIKDTTLENYVRQLYYKYYYTPMKIGEINDLLAAGQTFALGVNAGLKNGVKALQKAINKVYGVKISVDGVVGKETLSYANGDKSVEVGKETVNQCNAYYNNLVAKKPSMKKFLNGWLNRVKGVTKTCSTPVSTNILLTTKNNNGNWFMKLISFIKEVIDWFKTIKK